MKHYSADLLNNNEVVHNARLLIGESRGKTTANDTAITDYIDDASSNPLSNTLDGFVITSENENWILDARGSEFDPKGSNTILNYIRQIGFRTSTGEENILTFDYDGGITLSDTTTTTAGDFDIDLSHLDVHVGFAELNASTFVLSLYDGTDNTGTELATVDLSSLAGGGGGGGASTNPGNGVLPVKHDTGQTDSFFNSAISQTLSGFASVADVSYVQTLATTLTLTATAGLDAFSNGDTVVLNQIDATTGEVYPVDGTISGTPTATSATVTISAGDDSNFDDTANIGIYKVGTFGDITLDEDVIITGNLQVSGSTTTVNSMTVDLADQYVTLANTDLTADHAAVAGGIFVEQTVADTATTQVVTYAGIRVTTGGVWEITSNATTDDGTTGTWSPLGAGTTNKAVVNVAPTTNTVTGTFDGATATITAADVTVVDNISSGNASYKIAIDLDANSALPIGNTDITVTVYDDGLQVIPDEVALNRFDTDTSTDVTTATAGSITVYMPRGFNPTTSTKIVIIG